MTTKIAVGIVGCLMTPLLIGCATNSGTVRAQNPAGLNRQSPQTVQQINAAQFGGPSISYANAPPYAANAGYNGYPPGVAPAGYGSGQHDAHGLLQPLYHHHKPPVNWSPTHRHWSHYEPPRNLVYPPANQPPATVQYPYYTTKGPDDFFQK